MIVTMGLKSKWVITTEAKSRNRALDAGVYRTRPQTKKKEENQKLVEELKRSRVIGEQYIMIKSEKNVPKA